jgi:FkbM family methyltransferase
MDGFIIHEMAQDPYGLRSLLRPGDTVVDIGAHIGTFSILAGEICPQARIIAVEPVPANFDQLRRNVPESVETEQAAVSGRDGPVTIHDFGPTASASHSVYALGADGATEVTAKGKSLSTLFGEKNLSRVRFLKLDCEGAEFDIIPSTPSEVLARVDYIGMEVHSVIAKRDGVLGEVPDHIRKRRRMIAHLLRTHRPLSGDVWADAVQRWVRKGLLSWHRRFLARFRAVLWSRLRHGVLWRLQRRGPGGVSKV